MKDEEDEVRLEDLINNIDNTGENDENVRFRLQEKKNQHLYVFDKMEV